MMTLVQFLKGKTIRQAAIDLGNVFSVQTLFRWKHNKNEPSSAAKIILKQNNIEA